MSDEKKKGGFWSWFGLGKNKQEEPQEQASQEETNQHVQEPQPEVQETTEKNTALPDAAESENTLTEDTSADTSVDVESESNPVIEETLENSTALLDEETEAQAESAVEIPDEFQDHHEEESAVADMVETQEKPSEGGFFSRLLKGLVKTKQNIGAGFRSFFLGKKIDDDLFEELEEQLLIADIGVPTTTKIINNLTQHASRQQLQNADSLYQQLKLEMGEILKPVAQPLHIDGSKKPYVILMVGVNGVGKTTTIGKLARKFQMEGKSVMLAAGDTFRAAAVEQLQVWGERNHIPVVAQSTGSDSASVIFDAMQSAAARNIDILIADTAGRLQNKNNLMDELKKIVRVMKKYDESAPHEIMLTLDAGTGQNAISQAKLFHEAVGLTGISLTKLDGTAKGGVIFAIADQFNLPIRYIGVGEKIEDLREFNAEEFIEALFAHEEE
ncbi:signal recognition particle-docking protein FtsY [Aggregatibacter actinomycetemcomitans]|uniref:signal recognition particle-docking protein FtsY n=1 Tax=Aggregatibacter actinomycetemcomitans TaxID=714 RepID=UPI00197B0E86|nr:signal recognition particle-docking protein FtsY [Aggregatibacter actinomycetemcomitans]MBN6081141.1 signal recognition particle-docking protein FtsY [Aggregatibacter actinomycetemcomitans]